MPNWCMVDIEINGRHKLLKKINKILTETNDKYSSIPDMDYGVLFKLDNLNMALEKDDNVIWYCEELCKEKNINLKDVIEFGYKFVQKPTSILSHNLWAMRNQCALFKELVNLYLNKDKEKKRNSEDKFLLFSNLAPDNPLAFYREEILSKFKFNDGDVIISDIDDWYSNRVHKRWGTKWEPIIYDTRLEDDILTYSIETAWSPCTEFLLYLSELYDVTIVMRYREDGCGFAGRCEIVDGECEDTAYCEFSDNIIEYEALAHEAYWDTDIDGEDLFNNIYEQLDLILDDYITDELTEKYDNVDNILKHDKGARKEVLKLLKKSNISKSIKKEFKDAFNEMLNRKIKIKRIK